MNALRSLRTRLAGLLRRLYVFDRPSPVPGVTAIQVRLTLRQWIVLPAFLLALVWYLSRPTGPALVAALTLAGLLLASYLWARSMARRVTGARALRYAALQVGDELEEQVTLHNTSVLPVLWAEFSDHSDLPGYTVTSVRAANSGETVTWRARTTCTRRGVFSLGPWELRLGDPFGLFEVRQVYLHKNEILVYPPIAPLPERLLPRGRTQGEQRTLNQPLLAETQSAFTARPYQPGDPLRHIHWPITARHEAPFVKVFEPESSSTIWLVADADAAAHRGAGDDSTLETMVLLLSSLAARLLNEGVAVGLFTYSGGDIQAPSRSIPLGSRSTPLEPPSTPRKRRISLWPARPAALAQPPAETTQPAEPLVVLPRRGALHQWQILSALAVLSPAPGRPFAATLQKARTLVSSRDLVVAVTPSLSPDWLEGLHPFSHSRHRSSAQVILINPAEAATSVASSPSVDTFITILAEQGVRAGLVGRGELRPIQGTYGELNRWEFKTLGTGRIVVRHAPRPVSHPMEGK